MNHTLNGIALQLPPDDRHRLAGICTPVQLAAGQLLEHASESIQDPSVYFLDGATASLWIEPRHHDTCVAVTVVGREGMVGYSRLWPNGQASWRAQVLTPGLAHATSASQLRQLIAESPPLLQAISQFLWQQTQEIAQLHARTLLGDIRTRLALWLHLMRHKTGQTTLPVTHDALARMLGIRRVSITLLAGELQSEGVITLRRGEIEIKDLAALTRIARLSNS